MRPDGLPARPCGRPGMCSSTRTRTRSARRPGSMTPRSARPTASRRVLRNHGDRLRQGDAVHDLAEEECRLDQAERNVVGRQYVEQPVLGQRARRDVARMRAAAHDVGRAHQHAEAGLFRGARSRRRGRELGNADALLDRFLDMRGGGVVMAGQHDAARLAGGGDRRAVARRIALGFADAPLAELLELVIRQLQLALIVVGVGVEIDELALTRRVIHQRGEPDAVVTVENREAVEAVGCRDFAAQMDEMIGAQPVVAHAVLDRVGQLAHVVRRSGRHPRPCRRAARRRRW